MRAEDKAAGRDTSGKSVSRRSCPAFDATLRDPEYRRLADESEAARAAYKEVAGA